jgi:hypothetical protein
VPRTVERAHHLLPVAERLAAARAEPSASVQPCADAFAVCDVLFGESQLFGRKRVPACCTCVPGVGGSGLGFDELGARVARLPAGGPEGAVGLVGRPVVLALGAAD